MVDYYRYQEVSESITEGEPVFDNQAPQAVDDQFQVEIDSSENAFDVLVNDSDPDGDILQLTTSQQPRPNGQAQISGDLILYTPAAGFVGTDSFSYTIEDGFGGQASATVSVVVSSPNAAPVAQDDSATTQRDTQVSIDVLANDSDADGDPIEIVSIHPASQRQCQPAG